MMIKPGYAPIEQYTDDPAFSQGPWTDLYALGAVMHAMITGELPPAAVVRSIKDTYRPLASRELPAGEVYSPAFLAAVDHALQLRIPDRPESVAAFAAGSGCGTSGQVADMARRSCRRWVMQAGAGKGRGGFCCVRYGVGCWRGFDRRGRDRFGQRCAGWASVDSRWCGSCVYTHGHGIRSVWRVRRQAGGRCAFDVQSRRARRRRCGCGTAGSVCCIACVSIACETG